jgi:spermidine synthase
MQPLEYVEVARAVSDRGEVVLRSRRDPDAVAGPQVLELRVNGVFVMESCETSSEVVLAQTALGRVAEPHDVLVGGLGLGYTVHEVLADPRVRHVLVAELEEALVRWFRDGTIPHGRPYLADERLSIAVADVQQLVGEAAAGSFDLVLLDVDNGPDFLVHQSNAPLYRPTFLGQVRDALRPGGVVAVWSSTFSAPLAAALESVFGSSEATECPVVLQGREESYWLHSARRGADTPSARRGAPADGPVRPDDEERGEG